LKLEKKDPSVSTRASNRTLAILGFHKIGEPPAGGWETWFYVPEDTFAGYLGYLHRNGWQVIDLPAFLGGLAEPDSLPERAALITFDDGYRSNLHVALRYLRQFGYPAVIFVPTDFIGGYSTFDPGEPEEAICDWEDLRELEGWGVSVQSHGASHRPFSELALAEQEGELHRSKAVLEAGLGKRVEVFAYPYGDGGDPQSVGGALKRAGYRAACSYKGGPNPLPVANPYRLTRLAMGPNTDLRVALGQERNASPDGDRGLRRAYMDPDTPISPAKESDTGG
jgi:peptidoglycan/xylan/chitin deacetylase (PgdA/CDA1 family)